MKKKPKQAETPAMKALQKQRIENRAREIPKKYRKFYKKAMETNNEEAAIEVLCLECICRQKKEVVNCSYLTCPLFGVRPYTRN